MAEQSLHSSDIGSCKQELDGKGMAEAVRVAFDDLCALAQPAEGSPAVGDRAIGRSVSVPEKVFVLGGQGHQCGNRIRMEREIHGHVGLFGSENQLPGAQVQAFAPKLHDIADSHSAVVHHQDQRKRAEWNEPLLLFRSAILAEAITCANQADNFVARERHDRTPSRFRQLNRTRGILCYPFLAFRKTQEPTDESQFLGLSRSSNFAAGQVAGYSRGVERLERTHTGSGCPAQQLAFEEDAGLLDGAVRESAPFAIGEELMYGFFNRARGVGLILGPLGVVGPALDLSLGTRPVAQVERLADAFTGECAVDPNGTGATLKRLAFGFVLTAREMAPVGRQLVAFHASQYISFVHGFVHEQKLKLSLALSYIYRQPEYTSRTFQRPSGSVTYTKHNGPKGHKYQMGAIRVHVYKPKRILRYE